MSRTGFNLRKQRAADPTARAAASGCSVKTGQADSPVRDFIKNIRENSGNSVRRGREEAISYYSKTTGAAEEEARKFYDAVKSLCSSDKIVLELPPEELIRFLADGVYVPEGFDGRTYNSSKARQISRALAFGIMPIRALLRSKLASNKQSFSLVLSPPENVVYFNGNLDRVRNPSRKDYLEDPSNCLYGPEHAADCRAASIVRSMPMSELAGGPFRVVNDLALGDKEYGYSEALIFSRITPDLVEEVIANSEEDAAKARKILDKLGKIIPVTSRDQVQVVDSAESKEFDLPVKPSAPQLHFQTSDRVVMKPRLNNPSLEGSIADVSDAKVTVQWDNGERYIYDTVEALMRIMTQPGAAQPVEGMVVYSLPGMDDKTVYVLNALGIDPVTVHSLVSHAMPASKTAKGWRDVLKKSFTDFGLPLKRVSGYVFSNGPRPFVPKEWFEARLPEGGSLVIDLAPSKMMIRAGDTDDYVVPSKPLIFE